VPFLLSFLSFYAALPLLLAYLALIVVAHRNPVALDPSNYQVILDSCLRPRRGPKNL
jgi:hypothetical protein